MLKNTILLIFISFLSLITISCGDTLNPVTTVTPEIIDVKASKFTSSGESISVSFTAEKIMSKRNFDVYLKRGISVDKAQLIIQTDKFASAYDEIVQTFGEHSDVDKNGKILIILFDINGGVVTDTRRSYVGGYFTPKDLLAGEGNSAEIIYIDALNGLSTSSSTMVHELQHLINFNKNYIEKKRESEIWANEALSAASEIVFNKKIPDERISYFNNDPHGLIKNGDYFYSWLNGGSIADYATVSLFMYWLYIQGNGKDVFYNIANASIVNRGTYKAFVEAGAKIDTSLDSWGAILETWFIANVEKTSTGLTGYLNKLTPTPQLRYADQGTRKLYPGDVVYSTHSITTVLGIKSVNANSIYFAYNTNTIAHTSSNEADASAAEVTVPSLKMTSVLNLSLKDSKTEVHHDGPYKVDVIIPIDTISGARLNETNR